MAHKSFHHCVTCNETWKLPLTKVKGGKKTSLFAFLQSIPEHILLGSFSSFTSSTSTSFSWLIIDFPPFLSFPSDLLNECYQSGGTCMKT